MSKKLNVLITGGAGYIGSHVSLAFLDAGHKVTVFDRNEKNYKSLKKSLGKRKNIRIRLCVCRSDTENYKIKKNK